MGWRLLTSTDSKRIMARAKRPSHARPAPLPPADLLPPVLDAEDDDAHVSVTTAGDAPMTLENVGRALRALEQEFARLSANAAATNSDRSAAAVSPAGATDDGVVGDIHPFEYAWGKSGVNSATSYTLPESIYSGGMIFPLSGPWSQLPPSKACCTFALPLFNYMCVLFATLIIQYIFVYYIRLSNIENYDTVGVAGKGFMDCVADRNLVVLAMCAFLISVVGDLAESVEMLGWIYNIPTSRRLRTLAYRKIEDDEGGEPRLVFKHGIPRWYKVFWCFPICLAKIVLACWVLIEVRSFYFFLLFWIVH